MNKLTKLKTETLKRKLKQILDKVDFNTSLNSGKNYFLVITYLDIKDELDVRQEYETRKRQ